MVWARRYSSWCPLLPSGPEAVAGVDWARCRLHPSVYGRFWKNFIVCVACSRCLHSETWCIISLWPSYLAVIVAVFGCLWRTIGFLWEMLGTQCLVRQWMVSVVFGCCLWSKLDFCGDATGAIPGSTVDTCSASASRGSLTKFTYFPRCGRFVSCSIVSVLTQNGEVCPADAPVYGLFRAAHTCKYGHYFCDDPWLAVGV